MPPVVTLAATRALAPGERSPDGEVIAGLDGWLFVDGGEPGALAQFTGRADPGSDWADAWVQLLAHRRETAVRHGARSATVIVPDKLAVYPQYAPPGTEVCRPRPVQRIDARERLGWRYPLRQFIAAAEFAPVFARTDSHATPHGVRVLLAAVLAQLELAVPEEALVRPNTYHHAVGDLGAHYDPGPHERFEIPARTRGLEIVEDTEALFRSLGGHFGIGRVVRNPAPFIDASVLVFGGCHTFINPDHPGTLGESLARLFAEVRFLWMPCWCDPELIARERPDVVVYQTAERYLLDVPPPTIDSAEHERSARAGRPVSRASRGAPGAWRRRRSLMGRRAAGRS